MTLDPEDRMNIWTARFRSGALEAAYQDFVFKRNLKANFWGLVLGLALFVSYIFSDFIDSARPVETAAVRLGTTAICAVIVAGFANKTYAKHNDLATFAAITLMSAAMNTIIWLQAGVDQTFYIGIIQGSILFSILLRLSFPAMAVCFTMLLAGFAFASFSTAEAVVATLQFVNVAGVAAICLLGVYLLNRYQRDDFMKTRIIEKQNVQLKRLLEDAQKRSERKVAALNTLVHFIKTPLHQISGFSDILVSSVGDQATTDTAQNAGYIKNATASLTKNINNLLTYHRLEETEATAAAESIPVTEIIDDFAEIAPETIAVSRQGGDAGVVAADPEIIRTALRSLSGHYQDQECDASRVTLSSETIGGYATITVRDDGHILSAAQFSDLVQPLTNMEDYLSHSGDQMPMALRTVARAVDICGGMFVHAPQADGNRYEIRLPTALDQSAAA